MSIGQDWCSVGSDRCITSSNLALACTLNLTLKVLRQLTLSADTALPLLVEHFEANIRLTISGERGLGSFLTPLNDSESRGLTS